MENIILIKVELGCEVKYAFNLFTVNELLEAWLPEKAEVEPKVGGKFELFWDPENREINSTIGCKITGIEENQFVSFEWKGPAHFQSFMNVADPLTHVVVFFSPNKNDISKTNVILFHTGWRKDPEWQEARDFFDRSWTSALKELQVKIKNKSISFD